MLKWKGFGRKRSGPNFKVLSLRLPLPCEDSPLLHVGLFSLPAICDVYDFVFIQYISSLFSDKAAVAF
jgi:hypothetical protein